MYASSLIGDYTLNEVPIKINYAHCGEEHEKSECGEFLTLVFPAGIVVEEGDCLSVKEYETLLRWNESKRALR